MKLVAISDTHGSHAQVRLPEGDIIIHAGDVSKSGSKIEILDFLDWFHALDYRYKIFVAGNHDFFFETQSQKEIDSYIPNDIFYLNDSPCSIEGLNIWGSPVQPWFYDWAFNRRRGAEIRQHWDKIPGNTDILVTHGPPRGILDQTVRGEAVGCQDLSDVIGIQKPRIHIFGHIHEAYGRKLEGQTEFINASVLNERYQLVNEPIVVDLGVTQS